MGLISSNLFDTYKNGYIHIYIYNGILITNDTLAIQYMEPLTQLHHILPYVCLIACHGILFASFCSFNIMDMFWMHSGWVSVALY